MDHCDKWIAREWWNSSERRLRPAMLSKLSVSRSAPSLAVRKELNQCRADPCLWTSMEGASPWTWPLKFHKMKAAWKNRCGKGKRRWATAMRLVRRLSTSENSSRLNCGAIANGRMVKANRAVLKAHKCAVQKFRLLESVLKQERKVEKGIPLRKGSMFLCCLLINWLSITRLFSL